MKDDLSNAPPIASAETEVERPGRLESARQGLTPADFAVLVLSAVSLVASCVIVSRNKYFWNDELYTWFFVADPSFGSMWAAFNDKINNTPALYFVLGWLWVQAFGASELSLRLFSSLGIVASVVLAWLMVRRVYGFWPACLGVLSVFLTSIVVLEQNAEARMYGIFLALVLLGFYQVLRTADDARIGAMQWLGLALVQAAIVNTHLFGPFFSAAILCATIAMDLRRRRIRWRVYSAFVAGWVTFLLYVPAFLVQADAGNPRAWVPVPTLNDLLDLIGLREPAFADVRFIVGVLAVAMLIHLARGGMAPSRVSRGERDLLTVAGALALVPLAVFLISLTMKPVLWDRYVIPVLLAYSIVVTHLVSLILNSGRGDEGAWFRSPFWMRGMLSLVLGVLLVNPVVYALRQGRPEPPGRQDFSLGFERLPMVMDRSGMFLQRYFYSPRRAQYFYILDQQAALADESGPFGVQDYKHMEAFRRNYLESVGRQILTSEEFLGRADSFLVNAVADYEANCPPRVIGFSRGRSWSDMHCPQWFKTRILRNPAYDVRELGDIRNRTILLVTRKENPSALPSVE